jgi:hypothetical protein
MGSRANQEMRNKIGLPEIGRSEIGLDKPPPLERILLDWPEVAFE